MLRSRCLFLTSALVLAACGDDAAEFCGASDDASLNGITLAGEEQLFTFRNFTAAANNDCPAPSPPGGLVSVTIFSQQVEPAGTGLITLCLPRPDLLEGDAAGVTVPLNPDNHPALEDDRAHVIDVSADLGSGCRWAVDPATPPDGTARFQGLCGGAEDERGFELWLEGTVALIERCTGMPDRALEGTLGGHVSVFPE